ncbi:hypothetical protein WICPIJ_007447 [Wickerhamomyces pijperi]|uniref:Metacaspase-1 n=1 Tax=Wickerhamomyces pijperi TaxID=599730 RepID=A0A9P8TJ87_WICPI|nr:hypothetical protein WICPIJ_007447 [Wickerhamomyces pijperi]
MAVVVDISAARYSQRNKLASQVLNPVVPAPEMIIGVSHTLIDICGVMLYWIKSGSVASKGLEKSKVDSKSYYDLPHKPDSVNMSFVRINRVSLPLNLRHALVFNNASRASRFYSKKSPLTNDNISGSNLPFDQDHLKGDEQYNELNSFYSDLFTAEDPRAQQSLNQGDNGTPMNEIDELNREMAEFYGVESMDDYKPLEKQIKQGQQSSDEPVSSEFQPPEELQNLYNQSNHQDPIQPMTNHTKLSLFDRLQTNAPKIITTSTSTPHLNLALEEYIFNNTPLSKPFTNFTLMFYTNKPCVVIGKNQNPWKEVNIPKIQDLGIPLLRRFSGGGTVVHDLGNVNYSYISTRQLFDRNYFGSVITRFIDGVKQNERGDLLTQDQGLKVSGSAFKIAKGKSLHHGTMLLSSNLKVLSSLLSRDGLKEVEVRCQYSVDSVRVKVDNLGLKNDEFIDEVSAGFVDMYPDLEIVDISEEDILELRKLKEFQEIEERLTSWDWVYGNTPKFTYSITNDDQLTVSFHLEKGILKSFDLSDEKYAQDFKYLQQVLEQGEIIQFKGDQIAGYILDEKLSEFIGLKIDGNDSINVNTCLVFNIKSVESSYIDDWNSEDVGITGRIGSDNFVSVGFTYSRPSAPPPGQQQYQQFNRPSGPPPQQYQQYQQQPEQQQYSRPSAPPPNSRTYQNEPYSNNSNINSMNGYTRPTGPPPPSSVQSYGPNNSMNFQYSQCSGKKKALLIGINYIGTSNQLRGCINDAHAMKAFLIDRYGYKEEDMVVLTDDQRQMVKVPTRENILRACQWLVSDAAPNDSLVFHYSGHGGLEADPTGEEESGFNSCIYPVDFQAAGSIIDDTLHDLLVRPLPQGARLTALFDSCHSGTALDLPYVYSTKGVIKEPNMMKEVGQDGLTAFLSYARGDYSSMLSSLGNTVSRISKGGSSANRQQVIAKNFSAADVIMISGSKDDQTSADATSNGLQTGAMSYAFIGVLAENPNQSFLSLLNNMRSRLQGKYTQKPQLSASHPIDMNLQFIM